MSQLLGYIHLVLAIFFLRLFGQGLMSHTSSTSMAKIFDKNRGKALAISWLGLSFGEGVLPALTIYLLNVIFWKKIWLVISGFLILIVLPLIIYLLKN